MQASINHRSLRNYFSAGPGRAIHPVAISQPASVMSSSRGNMQLAVSLMLLYPEQEKELDNATTLVALVQLCLENKEQDEVFCAPTV